MPDRAAIFIDGNNWYHALKNLGVADLGRLDYSKISLKLVGPRDWLETRYYVGQVRQAGNPRLYADQRRFLSDLSRSNRKISVHLGRLEPRTVHNEAARELLDYLANLSVRLETQIYRDLHDLAQRHRRSEVFVEKAVDVMIAVDMVVMAERDAYDAAYLLSADGDFTPAVEAVRACGKKVYAASAGRGAQLAQAVVAFIPIDAAWLHGCYVQTP